MHTGLACERLDKQSSLKFDALFNSISVPHIQISCLISNFLNENVSIPIKISLKFVPEGPVNNIPALVQIMAWYQPGPVFYLLSWSQSHLAFSLQVTWSFSIFTPSDLEAKSLGEIPSDFGCWLADILDHSNILICILYLSKLIYVTLCRIFYNICQNSLHW